MPSTLDTFNYTCRIVGTSRYQNSYRETVTFMPGAPYRVPALSTLRQHRPGSEWDLDSYLTKMTNGGTAYGSAYLTHDTNEFSVTVPLLGADVALPLIHRSIANVAILWPRILRDLGIRYPHVEPTHEAHLHENALM